MSDWMGTTSFEVDLLQRITKVTDTKGNVVSYTYDEVGNQTSVAYPDGTAVTKTYDLLGQLKTVTETDGRTTTYTYDGMGRLSRMEYPHGWVEDYTYDAMGRLIRVEDTDPTQKDMKQQKHVYEYDVCGNMTYEYMRGNGTGEATVENTYTYDALHRIVQAHENYGNATRNYTYYRDRTFASYFISSADLVSKINRAWTTYHNEFMVYLGEYLTVNDLLAQAIDIVAGGVDAFVGLSGVNDVIGAPSLGSITQSVAEGLFPRTATNTLNAAHDVYAYIGNLNTLRYDGYEYYMTDDDVAAEFASELLSVNPTLFDSLFAKDYSRGFNERVSTVMAQNTPGNSSRSNYSSINDANAQALRNGVISDSIADLARIDPTFGSISVAEYQSIEKQIVVTYQYYNQLQALVQNSVG